MSTKLRVLATLGGIAVASMVVSQAANLISDGDFESPTVAPATQSSYPAGTVFGGAWTVSGGNVGLYTDAWTSHPNQVIADNQSLYFDVTGATIAQTVSLGAGSYLLSFKTAALSTGTYDIGYSIVGGSTTYASGSATGTTVAPSSDTTTVPFTVSSFDSVTISFWANEDDPQGALDDVSLVPEPETYALVAGLGLMLFAGYRRFRKA